MKAIFYDRNKDLVRCQFAGMNEKGKPEWLIIEQDKPTVTLAETERKEHRSQKYKLLCLEGEEVGELILLRILCSFISGEIEGWSSLSDDIYAFIKDMETHRVEWNKERIYLRFRISKDFEHEGKYCLSIYKNDHDCHLGYADGIEDLDQLLELIDDFCSMLEDFAHIENVYKIADISGVDENLFSENLLGRFDRVIKN